MWEIKKIIDERERQKTKKGRKERRGVSSYSESVTAKWFSFAINLGFVLLTSLILKSNLGLALSIILKERELYESKHVAVECKCLTTWVLLFFLICFSILVLKWEQTLPNF